ncbi:MAG: hypothetical protein ABIM41_05770 [candidate division WOR-3 bacterium]
MDEKLYIIQFMHPGSEPPISKKQEEKGKIKFYKGKEEGIIYWNDGDKHHRKFLEIEGKYLTSLNSKPEEALLCFWGEWEPESKFKKISDSKPERGFPQYIHTPIFNKNKKKSKRDLLNTDPFVFCSKFYYTVCQQSKNKNTLRSLGKGSVILFGSHLNGNFVLDTVFVVKEFYDYNPNNYKTLDDKYKLPDVYKEVTLDLLSNEPSMKKCLTKEGCLPEGMLLRFYIGATYDDPVNGMFSFFPCLPSPTAFERPIIEGEFISPELKQGYKKTEVKDLNEMKKYWEKVVDQVLHQKHYSGQQNLYLGIYANCPEIRTSV